MARWPPPFSPHSRPAGSRMLNPSHSASCCADTSDSQSPSSLARADVAANSTLLATVALRVQEREFWAGGGPPLRLLLHRHAEKRERGCPRTSSFAIWTSVSSTDWMADSRKSLRMGSRCGEEHNLRSTQHWFPHCTEMALQEEEQRTETSVALDAARRKKERAYPGDLWCWLPRWERRWSYETAQFLNALAEARSQSVPLILQGAEAAWLRRSAVLVCSAARAFAVIARQAPCPR